MRAWAAESAMNRDSVAGITRYASSWVAQKTSAATFSQPALSNLRSYRQLYGFLDVDKSLNIKVRSDLGE